MTSVEILMARAIGRVTYCPGIGTKRFAREMAFLADHEPDRALTPKQAKYLLEVVVRYRRQIPADVVGFARELLTQQAPTT